MMVQLVYLRRCATLIVCVFTYVTCLVPDRSRLFRTAPSAEMQLHSSSLLALTLTLSGLLPAGSADTLDRRIAVSENKLSEMTGYLAFTAASVGASGKLLMSESRDGNAWTQWLGHVHSLLVFLATYLRGALPNVTRRMIIQC